MRRGQVRLYTLAVVALEVGVLAAFAAVILTAATVFLRRNITP